MPQTSLNLTSANSEQSVCVGEDIEPIEYDVFGDFTGASFDQLPPGVSGNFTPLQAQVEFSFHGNAAILAGEIYGVQVNEINYEYSSQSADAPLTIAQALIDRLNTREDIVAEIRSNTIVIRSLIEGSGLQISPYTRENAQITFGIPVQTQAAGHIQISGSPLAIAEDQQLFQYNIQLSGGACITEEYRGEILLSTHSNLVLNTTSDTLNQTLCDGEALADIEIEYGTNVGSIRVIGDLPNGILYSTDINSRTIRFFGQSDVQNLEPQTYQITLTTVGNSGGCNETSLEIIFEILPDDRIELISSESTSSQRLCSDDPNSQLTTIQYRLNGTMEDYQITGLPRGIVHAYDPDTQILEINGSVEGVTAPTVFTYEIWTLNSICGTTRLQGTIHVDTNHALVLDSGALSANQTGAHAVCNNTPIVPIQYSYGNGAEDVVVTGLPLGLKVYPSGPNQIQISGTPDPNQNLNQVFQYTITTIGGNSCETASLEGSIEIYPKVEIDKTFIEIQDIQHISCNGQQDGAIDIPLDPDELSLRIQGGIPNVSQVDHIHFSGVPEILDVIFVEVNSIRFSHTVIPQTVGGPAQNLTQILEALIEEVNTYEVENNFGVRASLQSTSTLVLGATQAGEEFEINTFGVEQADSNVLLNHQNVTQNRRGNYTFEWQGPNGFQSNSLSISNLFAGNYTLSVFVSGCSHERTSASFQILQPDPVEMTSNYCNSAISIHMSGGVGPYIFELFDDQNNLIASAVSPASHLFENLIPGKQYTFKANDQECDSGFERTVVLPLELEFNRNLVQIQHDSCTQEPNTGEGSIVLDSSSANSVITGGSGTFHYRWTGPNGFQSTQKSIQGLLPGVYTLQISDAEWGCQHSESFEINGTLPLEIVATPESGLSSRSIKLLSCSNEKDAGVELSVTGGSGSYTYQWLYNGNLINTSTGPSISGLIPGTYTCIVKDRNSTVPCETNFSFQVSAPDPISLYYTLTAEPDQICRAEDISLNVEILGGTPPYRLFVNNELLSSQVTRTQFIQPLNASLRSSGEIELSLVDANNCSPTFTSSPIEIADYTFVEIRAEATKIDCSRGITGAIQLTIIAGQIQNTRATQIEFQGGNLHRISSWEDSQGRIQNIREPGNYQIRVTDSGGCLLFSETIAVLSNASADLQVEVSQVTPPGCNGAEGSIALSIQGGISPYTIIWEIFDSPSSTSSNTSLTTNWKTINGLQNRLIANNLEEGIYRVRVSDRSTPIEQGDCTNNFTSENIYLYDQENMIAGFRSTPEINNCDYNDQTYTIEFRYIGNFSSPPDIRLNPPSGDLIRFDSAAQYRFENVDPGAYTLSVVNSSTQCPILYPFTLLEIEPIEYSGVIQYEEDICNETSKLFIDSNLVSGGIPYVVDDLKAYAYHWSYVSADGLENQNFVGTEIVNPDPGSYTLQIYDQNRCSLTPPLAYELETSIEEVFRIDGILSQSDQTVKVKALAPSCGSEELKGQIGVVVGGGIEPYQINWDYLDASAASSSTHWVDLPQFQNRTYLSGLEPGNYRIQIVSQNDICASTNPESPYVFYEEIIVVPEQVDVTLVDGPYISANICDLNPGTITLSIYNQIEEDLEFYYNETRLDVVNTSQGELETNYTLEIPNPVEEGMIRIFSTSGCLLLDVPVVVELIGSASFSYTSANLELNNQLIPREEILFRNTSKGNYFEEEWNFGDSSPKVNRTRNSTTVSPVTHEYTTSGTYHVTLRIYNELGCFEQLIQTLVVGNGYNVQFPTVFTPNGDQINDFFRPVTNGFEAIEMNIYTSSGQIIYREQVERTNALEPIAIEGWKGDTDIESTYFIYSFIGTLPDGSTVDRSGTFILLR